MKPTDEIKELEQQYWDAIRNNDTWTAMKLSDDRCIVVGAQGVGSLDRDKLGEMMNRARYELTQYRFNDETFQFRKLTDDVVLVAYAVYEDLVVDGKAESIEAFDASVWVRRDDGWHCAMHTESLKGDPFGRADIDRMTASQMTAS